MMQNNITKHLFNLETRLEWGTCEKSYWIQETHLFHFNGTQMNKSYYTFSPNKASFLILMHQNTMIYKRCIRKKNEKGNGCNVPKFKQARERLGEKEREGGESTEALKSEFGVVMTLS